MIEYLPLVLTGIGLTASIFYYASNLRNANITQKMQLETRQVQLFMTINEARATPEFQKLIYRVTFMDTWDDIADYHKKFGPETNLDAYSEHLYIWERFDTLGFLLQKGVIDMSYFDDVLRASTVVAWDKFKPVIYSIRETVNKPKFWNQFEYLADEIKKTQ